MDIIYFSGIPPKVIDPDPKVKIERIDRKKLLKKCDSKVTLVVLSIFLILTAIALPVEAYCFHYISLTELCFFATALTLIALCVIKFKNERDLRSTQKKIVKHLENYDIKSEGLDKLNLDQFVHFMHYAPKKAKEAVSVYPAPKYNYAKLAKKEIKYVEKDLHKSEQSFRSQLGFKDYYPSKGVGFIGGILYTPADTYLCARLISRLVGVKNPVNVHFVHNASHGAWDDLCECELGGQLLAREPVDGVLTEPVLHLHKLWDEFFENAPEGAEFLQFCHSQGAIHVKNALSCYPQARRGRISVVAIAPGAYITPDISSNVIHYISDDLIPRIDKKGKKLAAKRIFYVNASTKDFFANHSFASDLYLNIIGEEVVRFVNRPLINRPRKKIPRVA